MPIWMELEGIMLNKSDREKPILYDLTSMWKLKEPNKQEEEWLLPRMQVGELGRYGSKGANWKLEEE